MHVAINGYFWDKPFVGSGYYTRQLVYYLNRLVSDLEITLVVPDTAVPPADVPPSVTVFPVKSKPGQVGKVLFEQRGFPQAAAAVQADVAHVPYFGGPLQSPVPLVVTVHDLTTMLVPEYRRPFKARLYNALVAASARGADHIITDSHASKTDIVRHLAIPEEQVSAIYLAVGPQYTPKEDLLLDMAVQKKYDLPDFYVLYLGGYELHKNVTTLLLAYSYVGQALGEEYPLVLAGKKPTAVSAIYPDYDRYIQKLGIGDYVRWIGYVDEADKPAIYRNAMTFAFPSRHEGFGLPVLEAMACGVPVVTTTGGSLPEVVGNAGFAIDPDDARQMAGSIIATLIQDPLRAEMVQKSQQQAATFSWETAAAETALVYTRVVNGR